MSRRYVVAIAGLPGSGKTTTAFEVAKMVNQLRGEGEDEAATVVQMDGEPLLLTARLIHFEAASTGMDSQNIVVKQDSTSTEASWM